LIGRNALRLQVGHSGSHLHHVRVHVHGLLVVVELIRVRVDVVRKQTWVLDWRSWIELRLMRREGESCRDDGHRCGVAIDITVEIIPKLISYLAISS